MDIEVDVGIVSTEELVAMIGANFPKLRYTREGNEIRVTDIDERRVSQDLLFSYIKWLKMELGEKSSLVSPCVDWMTVSFTEYLRE